MFDSFLEGGNMLDVMGSVVNHKNGELLPEIIMVMTIALLRIENIPEDIYFASIAFEQMYKNKGGDHVDFTATIRSRSSDVFLPPLFGTVHLKVMSKNPTDKNAVSFAKDDLVSTNKKKKTKT